MSILEIADKIVSGERQEDYGKPEDCFDAIGRAWSAYLSQAHGDPAPISGSDVAAMMVMLKAIRQGNKPKEDNWVDIAGYAECGARCDRVH